MGRKKGGKNFGNFVEAQQGSIEVTEGERHELPTIFTSIAKDFITIQDLIDTSGLSYDTCARIIREIKSVSDVFKISGCVHRTYIYIYHGVSRFKAWVHKNSKRVNFARHLKRS